MQSWNACNRGNVFVRKKTVKISHVISITSYTWYIVILWCETVVLVGALYFVQETAFRKRSVSCAQPIITHYRPPIPNYTGILFATKYSEEYVIHRYHAVSYDKQRIARGPGLGFLVRSTQFVVASRLSSCRQQTWPALLYDSAVRSKHRTAVFGL